MNIIGTLFFIASCIVIHAFITLMTYEMALGKNGAGSFHIQSRRARRLYVLGGFIPFGTLCWVLCAVIHEFISDRINGLKGVYPMIKEAIE